MTELRDLLESIAGRARTYDVTESAITVSRRRRRNSRAAGSVAVAIAVAATAIAVRGVASPADRPAPTGNVATSPSPVPSKPAGPVACDVQRLPLPPGTWLQSLTTAISPSGRFIAGTYGKDIGTDKLIIWEDLRPTTLPLGGDDAMIYAIGNNGDAVGGFFADGADIDEQQAFYWHNGTVTVLKGLNAAAYAINSKGVIAGIVQDRPAIWRDPTKSPEFLAVPDSAAAIAITGIDDEGNVIGLVERKDGRIGDNRAAMWSASGTFQWLPHPVALAESWALRPTGFRNGNVAIFAYNRADAQFASHETQWGWWDPRSGEYTLHQGVPNVATSFASDSGWQIVTRRDASYLANTTSEVKLDQPADVLGSSAYQHSMTPDGRAITAGLHVDTEMIGGRPNTTASLGIVAVVWKCR